MEQIESRIERAKSAQVADMQAAEIRRAAAMLETSVYRLERRFAVARDLPKSVRDAAALGLSLKATEDAINSMSDPTRRLLTARAASQTITELRGKLLAQLVADEDVRAGYGSHLSNLYELCALITNDTAPATRRAKTSVLARGKTKTWLSGTVALVKTKGGGKPVVHVTASSDHEDLELDVFELSALKEMRDGFQGRLMFLNHNYQVPSDVFGMIDGAVLNKRGGNTFLDLTVGVETANPAAAETHAMIENGTRLGVSVGVIVRDAVKRDGGGFSIRHVTPLEVSIVGIPANQDAGWTRGG